MTAVLRRRGDVLTGRWTGPLRGWLGLERAAHALVVRPTLRLADGVAAVDDRVLSRAVDAVGRGAVTGARGVVRGERGLSALVDAVARGAGRASESGVRRSSGSGQLHHYYLQVAVALLLVVLAVSLPLLVLSLTNPR